MSGPENFYRELKGPELKQREAELAAVRQSVDEKIAATGAAPGGYIAPAWKGEREGEAGMCGVGIYAKPCAERGVKPQERRLGSVPDLVLP